MDYEEKIGICKQLLPGMFVRVPVETQRSDGLYRDFRIGKVIAFNEAANTVTVSLINFSPGLDPVEENLECSLRDIMRCRALPDTKVKWQTYDKAGRILIDCESGWVEGEFKKYYVEMDNEIICIGENELILPSHRQNPHPFQQLQSYEMQNPRWKWIRDDVVTCISELRNSTYGLDDLVGSRVRLLAHQAEVIARVLGDPKGRFVLADEVGLGKTIEACVILRGLRRRKGKLTTLILVPESLTVQWQNELSQKFWLNFPILPAGENMPANIKEPGAIVSLEALEASEDVNFVLYAQLWDLLIVDEAHHVAKSDDLFERVKLLSEQSTRSLILSATPIQRRAQEFLSLLNLMDPESYVGMSEIEFLKILDAQDRIRRKIVSLTNLLSFGDFDGAEFLTELQQVTTILHTDNCLQTLVDKLQGQVHNPHMAKATCQYILAYLSENYRIENRVIRNRRASLTVDLPVREADMNYAYQAGDGENSCLLALYDYAGNLLKKSVREPVLLEYCRLLLFAAASSPHALLSLLEQRQTHLRQSHNRSDSQPDMIRPGAPRQEKARVKRIVQSLAPFDDESITLDSLVYQVTDWKEKTDIGLKGKYSYKNPPPEDSRSRILQIIRALYKITNQGDLKVIVFCAWQETLDVLEKAVKWNFAERKSTRFSADMDQETLEKAADRFQTDDDCQILLSDELGGEGRNFQIADHIIHVDIPWTPAVLEQRIGRVDRLGRSGKVVSIIPYAKGTVEEDLFEIWENAFNLFTQSMSGMEIALEDIQDKLSSALFSSVRNGLANIKDEMKEHAKKLRETVEEERYFEEGAINHRRRAEIEATSRRYQDGSAIHHPILAWAELAGLTFRYTNNPDVLYFDPKSFNRTSYENARFVDPPNMEDALLRSRRQHNMVITGTFNRDVAIKEEDLVFFAPGNDRWTDAILKNSLESDRGRCCGIGRVALDIDTDLLIFDLLYSILVNPRPLYSHGYNSTHLFRAQGYLQKPTYRILISKDGEVLPKNHPAWEITKKHFIAAQDFHLGKRDGTKAQIQKFQTQFNPQEWSTILKGVIKAAEEKIGEEFDFVEDLAEEAGEEFRHQAAGQKAALQFLYAGKDCQPSFEEVDQFERISADLVEGIRKPIFELESVCMWMIQGKQ